MRALDTFQDIDLFKYLFKILKEFFSRQISEGENIKKTNFEIYNIYVLLYAHNILECLDQVNYSINMLSGFKTKNKFNMNRHDYIVFMVENFYLRSTSIFDRILRFTNIALEIGLPEKECKESTIIKNENIKGTKLYTALKNINNFLESFRENRNKIAHSESFSEEKLNYIKSYYVALETDDFKDIEKFKKFFKFDTDEYVVDKKKEFKNIVNDLEKLLIVFFNEIAPFIYINGERYKK
ncbi:MAG: Cthe_2314 family HEPN domain-containing protein [Bacteroidales bacterium]|nr:Cthe_2314 family HEPN domain-containing protein [Bacteroidales bacterium]